MLVDVLCVAVICDAYLLVVSSVAWRLLVLIAWSCFVYVAFDCVDLMSCCSDLRI